MAPDVHASQTFILRSTAAESLSHRSRDLKPIIHTAKVINRHLRLTTRISQSSRAAVNRPARKRRTCRLSRFTVTPAMRQGFIGFCAEELNGCWSKMKSTSGGRSRVGAVNIKGRSWITWVVIKDGHTLAVKPGGVRLCLLLFFLWFHSRL